MGNLKKWKEGYVEINFEHEGRPEHLRAWLVENRGREHTVRFEWSAAMTFGQLLEYLGRIPIPPYLNRESEEIDYTRYQTVYSKFEGSVAAPTAGLHFTPELIEGMKARGFGFEEVTLHVGAGTFLPVKDDDAARHPMHTEHFEVRRAAVARLLEKLGADHGRRHDLGADARIAHGAGVAHTYGRNARSRSGSSVSGSCTTCRRSFPGREALEDSAEIHG